MLIKKIIFGVLIFLFPFGLASAAVAEGYGTPNVYIGTKGSYNFMGDDGIEFDYTPMTDNSGLASASSGNTDSDVIEFDYSPREGRKIIATHPFMNTDSDEIQFDYSPRSVDCGTPYC